VRADKWHRLPACETVGADLCVRRVFQFLEIAFIGSIPDIHFRVEGFPAFRAILPVSAMLFNMVKATQGVTAMIPVTTVVRWIRFYWT